MKYNINDIIITKYFASITITIAVFDGCSMELDVDSWICGRRGVSYYNKSALLLDLPDDGWPVSSLLYWSCVTQNGHLCENTIAMCCHCHRTMIYLMICYMSALSCFVTFVVICPNWTTNHYSLRPHIDCGFRVFGLPHLFLPYASYVIALLKLLPIDVTYFCWHFCMCVCNLHVAFYCLLFAWWFCYFQINYDLI